MDKDISYGRVSSVQKQLRRHRRNERIVVCVSYWLTEWKPPYISGSYLQYETDDNQYQIYNPLGIAFDIKQLQSHLVTWHNRNDESIISAFSIKGCG